MKYVVLTALLTLAACVNPSVTSKVDAAVVGLTAAERAALIYTSLPRCPTTVICSDPATVAKIKSLDNQAYVAVKAAEQNEALLSAALSSISTLTSAIPASVTR